MSDEERVSFNSLLITFYSLLSLPFAGKIETQILTQPVKPVAGTLKASDSIN